ncbi:MAG TPA: glycosyltransferase, partial [Longimicrobiaceae bacterium]|nr:glycosyltransferase [Longimicrobiaceae bacterium]
MSPTAAAVARAAPAADPLPAASRPTCQIARISLLLPDLFDAVGGIQTFCRTLVLALDGLAAERGWTVETLVLNDRGGSDLARLYMPGSAAGYRAFGGSRARFAAAAVRAGLRSDVVVVGHVNFAPLALAMPGRARHLAAYGVDVWHRLPRLQRAAASRMDRILAISEFTRDRMAESNGLAAGRFTLFPTSLDPLHHG